MNRLKLLSLLAWSFLPACHKQDERLTALEKRVEALEKRPAGRPTPPPPDTNTVQNIPLHSEDIVRGNGKAVIVEAFDFACPYCAMTTTAVDQLLEKHANDVKVVSKHFVVHAETATLPALAVCAAQAQGKGAQYEHALWEKGWGVGGAAQPHFDVAKMKADALDDFAKSLKLDVAKFQKDRDGETCKQQLARDQSEMSNVGVRGTPTFFVNGRLYAGPRTVEGFEQAIARVN